MDLRLPSNKSHKAKDITWLMAELDKNQACGSMGSDETPQEVSFIPLFLQIIHIILLNLYLI